VANNYADEASIRAHLGQYGVGWPRADGSAPTVNDGLAHAERASGEIDRALSARGLTTPVTGPDSFLKELRGLAATYAAAMVAAGLFPQSQGPSSTTFHSFLMGIYQNGLNALRTGNDLPLAAAQDTISLARSFWTSHPVDDDGVATDVPVFKRTMVW
jgi:hypothetical protein